MVEPLGLRYIQTKFDIKAKIYGIEYGLVIQYSLVMYKYIMQLFARECTNFKLQEFSEYTE